VVGIGKDKGKEGGGGYVRHSPNDKKRTGGTDETRVRRRVGRQLGTITSQGTELSNKEENTFLGT